MNSGWIFVSPAAGVVGAALVVISIRLTVKEFTWKGMVDGGAPWSPYDSWVTNISTLFAGIGSLWATLGGLATVVTTAVSASVSVMFVVCGGSAALAPVVYAALAKKEATNKGEAIGTVAGLLLAAAATLFAIFGELAAVSLVVWQVSSAPWARASESLVQLLILAAGAFISVYSWRTLYSVTGSKPAAAPAADTRPASYFMTASPSSRRRSATL